MSKILELQKKAQSLLSEHQKNIESELESGINQIFSDTHRTLNKKAQSLSESIDSTKQNIQMHQSEATAQVMQQITADSQQITAKYQQTTKELWKVQQQQIEKLKANLIESNDLSQVTADQVKLKKALFTSNIVLISVICILIISSIFLGYVNSVKYSELNQIKELKQIESQKLAEVQQALVLSKAELKKIYPSIKFKD